MPAPAAAPPAPAPAAPAPSPSPTPAPAPAPTPSPESGDSPFAELEAQWSKVEVPPKAKPEAAKPEKPETAPKDKVEAPKPEPTDKAKPFTAPKEMRDHMAKLEGDLKAKDSEMGKLRSQITELQSKTKEIGTLSERITAVEKERDDAQAQVRALKQEASPEFIKQYDKPFKDAANYAKGIIEDLSIVEGETTRPAKWDDFAALYNLPPGKANKAARELFGDNAQTVINHMQELHRLEYNKNQALAEERENAKKRTTEEESKAAQQREQIQSKWVAVNKDLSESVYHDDPEDKDSAEVRSKALAIFDSQPKTLNERIIKDAHIRHMVADRQVLKRKLKLVETELAEAKKELEGFKKPQPNKGKHTSTAASGPEKSWEDEAREALT